MLADAPRSQPLASTKVFDAPEQAAEAAVQRIIAAHLGAQPKPVAAAKAARHG
jgi:hypothetical protein